MTTRFRLLVFTVLTASLASSASAATLLLHYNFDEAPIGNVPAADTGTGTPAPGLFEGGATRTSDTPQGFSLGALDLTTPGGGTFVQGGDAEKLDGLTSFTLTAWVNLRDTPSGNLRIMSKQAGGSFPGFSWNIADPASGTRTASNFGLRLFVGGTTAFTFDGTPTGLNIDAEFKWVFLAVSYDGTLASDNVSYYVGDPMTTAELRSTTSVNAGALAADNTARFGVGFTDAAPTADTAPPAFIDDVRVYDGVLTAAELESVRRANVPEPTTGASLFLGLGAILLRRRRAV